MVLCSIIKTHFWVLILLIQQKENQRVCILFFSHIVAIHTAGYGILMFILSKHSCFDTENISSFLPSSLLSAPKECFPVAKWNHVHDLQRKVFYSNIVPATKDVLRTCCWLVSAEAAGDTEAHPPQMRPSHCPTGSNSEKLVQPEVTHSQTEGWQGSCWHALFGMGTEGAWEQILWMNFLPKRLTRPFFSGELLSPAHMALPIWFPPAGHSAQMALVQSFISYS